MTQQQQIKEMIEKYQKRYDKSDNEAGEDILLVIILQDLTKLQAEQPKQENDIDKIMAETSKRGKGLSEEQAKKIIDMVGNNLNTTRSQTIVKPMSPPALRPYIYINPIMGALESHGFLPTYNKKKIVQDILEEYLTQKTTVPNDGKVKYKTAIHLITEYENDNDFNKFGISNKITDFEMWLRLQNSK